MSKKAFALCNVSVAYIVYVIAFFGIRYLLAEQEIEYRLWLTVMGYGLIVLGPMVLIALWARLLYLSIITKREEADLPVKGNKAAAMILFVVYIFLCTVIIWFCFFFFVFTTHEERVARDGTLQVMYGGFPGEGYWFDYERVSFWGRRQRAGITDQQMLEDKYGCKFTIDDRGFDIGRIYFIPENDPNISVSVYKGMYGTEKAEDDYAVCYLTRTFTEGKDRCHISSESGSIDFDHFFMEFYLYVQDTPENRKALADDAAALIAYTLEELKKDPDAPCDGGELHVGILQEDEMQYEIARHYVTLPFGNMEELETAGKDADYYTSAEHVYQEIQEQLPEATEPASEKDTSEDTAIEEDLTGYDEEESVSDTEPSWESEIEELARCIYDAELADTENHFEMTYNAKGNPYAILSEGKKELSTGETIDTRRTLVYDRPSQNGLCELFVYYEEKYYLDGTPLDTTEILDMYAVDKESHEVYPSGRKAWADLGNQVYREATGE